MDGTRSQLTSAPNFRTKASRFLLPNSTANNDHSTIRYIHAQTDEIDDLQHSDKGHSVEKQPYISHDSVDASSTGNNHSDARSQTLWNGLPVYELTWEFLGIVISILFLILGAFIAHLKDQNETEWSKRVIQATRIAPSIWPILFSGIMGNAVRRFASWRAEREYSCW